VLAVVAVPAADCWVVGVLDVVGVVATLVGVTEAPLVVDCVLG
jgi:hypothetical protein